MKREDLALSTFLSPGYSGCMNNLTEEERKEAGEFINFPEKNSINLGEGRVINHPVIQSRLRKAVAKHGIVALEILNIICFGDPDDGHNSYIESTRLLNLTKELMKGEE